MVLNYINNLAGFLNENTFFAGIMLLLLNVGSRYIVDEFSNDPIQYSQNIFLRRLCIFAVCFVGTKDLITSLILTSGFVILASGIFRGKEQSREGMKNKLSINTMYDPSPPLFE
jgi:hypothetical protein